MTVDEIAREIVAREGGFVMDPDDPGGATKYGVTIGTMREWAYGRAYQTSEQRKAELPYWLHHYNWHRPHAGIQRKPPISRSRLDLNNLVRFHS